jgi:hypothetical protein
VPAELVAQRGQHLVGVHDAILGLRRAEQALVRIPVIDADEGVDRQAEATPLQLSGAPPRRGRPEVIIAP